MLMSRCARPAVYTPAGRLPGNAQVSAVSLPASHGKNDSPRGNAHHPVRPKSSTPGSRAAPFDEISPTVVRVKTSIPDPDPFQGPLRVLGSGEVFLELVEAEAVVDALQEDPAQLVVTLDDAHGRTPCCRISRAAAMPAAPPPMTAASKWSSLHSRPRRRKLPCPFFVTWLRRKPRFPHQNLEDAGGAEPALAPAHARTGEVLDAVHRACGPSGWPPRSPPRRPFRSGIRCSRRRGPPGSGPPLPGRWLHAAAGPAR